MLPNVLPHNANGIDAGDFVVRFLGDKILFAKKGASEHFTFHAGGHWKELDIHRTWTGEDGSIHHERLYAIRHDDIPNLLQDFIPIINDLLSLLRPVNVEELERGGIRVVRGLDPVTNDQIEASTYVHKKRLAVDPARLQQTVECAEDCREVQWFEDGGFSLFAGHHRIGIGIKGTDRFGGKHICWLKISDLRRFMQKAEPRIAQIFKAHQVKGDKEDSTEQIDRDRDATA